MRFKLRDSYKPKRRKVPTGETSEVLSKVVGDVSIACSQYSTLSLYKYQTSVENCLFFSNYNSRQLITTAMLIVSNFSTPNGIALKKIASDCWIEQISKLSLNDKTAFNPNEFFELLNFELLRVGISDSFFDYYSYAHNHDKQTMQISTSRPRWVVRINENRGETLEDSNSSKEVQINTFEWKVGNSKAVVFANGCDGKLLVNQSTRIAGLTYPKKGAAELLHFELKKVGVLSNVFWTEISNRAQ